MGINLKILPWAGNVYHQFESLCQDVDEFLSQDTVQLVENQMQNVDIFPRFEDIGSPKSQSVDPTCIDEEQLSVNQDSVDNTDNSDAPSPIEVKPLHADSSQESVTCQPHLRKHGETVIMNKIFIGTKLAIEKEQGRFYERKGEDGPSVEPQWVSDTGTSSQCDENSKLAIEKEQGFFYERKGEDGPSVEPEWVSDTGTSSQCDENSKLAIEKEQAFFYERKGEDGPSVEPKWVSDTSSCRSLLSESELRLLEGYSLLMDLDLDSSEYEEEEKEEETGFTKSTYSTSTKCFYTLDSSWANRLPENISDFLAEPDDFAYERKIEDMLPSFLLSELYGGSSFTDRPDSLLGSFETRHEQPYEHGQSKTAIIPSETGTSCEFGVGIDDDNMETVNLSPKVKHNATSVGSEINLAHSASSTRKDFKYFKNVIQGAFTSRKRLTKEYEHLAVLHGEIDLESSQNFEASSITVHSVKSESDWELL